MTSTDQLARALTNPPDDPTTDDPINVVDALYAIASALDRLADAVASRPEA
jgi:hypothetical protein